MTSPRTVTVVDSAGVAREMTYGPHDTLMTIAVRLAVKGIEARCGGACACGTCAVEINDAWRASLDEMAPGERDILEFTGRDLSSVRLSCQLRLDARHDGLRATVINNDID